VRKLLNSSSPHSRKYCYAAALPGPTRQGNFFEVIGTLERFIAYRNRSGFPNHQNCDSWWMLEWKLGSMTRPYP